MENDENNLGKEVKVNEPKSPQHIPTEKIQPILASNSSDNVYF